MACPKCRTKKHVLCLAGGVVLTIVKEAPLYCKLCKLSFIAKKKENQN